MKFLAIEHPAPRGFPRPQIAAPAAALATLGLTLPVQAGITPDALATNGLPPRRAPIELAAKKRARK